MKIVSTPWLQGVLAMMVATTAASLLSAAENAPSKVRVYIGTYTGGASEGIYLATLDLTDGTLSPPQLVAEAVNPSFLAIHPSEKWLYAVGEISDFQGKKSGGVSSFAVDAASGKLTLLNQQSSVGAGPCHLNVDASGQNVIVANYGGGSVACLPIQPDGLLKEASAFVQHEGSSVNLQRQAAPHAHSVNLDPANRFAIVADLGLDKLLVYRFDYGQGTLKPNDPPAAFITAGGGPRHFAFHPNGKFAYTNNEMGMTVTALRYDARKGTFEVLGSAPTLPDGIAGEKHSTAEVRVHPNGRFVYVSNRGHDTIALFAVDDSTGLLTPIGHESTRGAIPRNFNLDPSGAFLLAANQDTNNVVVFRVDPDSGKLTFTGSEIEVGSPVCVRFMSAPAP